MSPAFTKYDWVGGQRAEEKKKRLSAGQKRSLSHHMVVVSDVGAQVVAMDTTGTHLISWSNTGYLESGTAGSYAWTGRTNITSGSSIGRFDSFVLLDGLPRIYVRTVHVFETQRERERVVGSAFGLFVYWLIEPLSVNRLVWNNRRGLAYAV